MWTKDTMVMIYLPAGTTLELADEIVSEVLAKKHTKLYVVKSGRYNGRKVYTLIDSKQREIERS